MNFLSNMSDVEPPDQPIKLEVSYLQLSPHRLKRLCHCHLFLAMIPCSCPLCQNTKNSGPRQALKEELRDMDCDVSTDILQAAGIGVVDAAYTSVDDKV